MWTGFERYTKKTRRAEFLEEMDRLVPWAKLCGLIEPHYPKAGGGRRPKELEQMLRIYFVQQEHGLGGQMLETVNLQQVVELAHRGLIRRRLGRRRGCGAIRAIAGRAR